MAGANAHGRGPGAENQRFTTTTASRATGHWQRVAREQPGRACGADWRASPEHVPGARHRQPVQHAPGGAGRAQRAARAAAQRRPAGAAWRQATTLQPTFQAHLTKYWLPFARDIIDHLLKFGMCRFASSSRILKGGQTRQTRERSGDKTQGRGVRRARPSRRATRSPWSPCSAPTTSAGPSARGLHAQLLQPGPGHDDQAGRGVLRPRAPARRCRQHQLANRLRLRAGSFVPPTDLAYTAEVRAPAGRDDASQKPDKINCSIRGSFFDSESRLRGGQQAETESAALSSRCRRRSRGDQPAPDAPRGRRPAQPPPESGALPSRRRTSRRLFVLPKVCCRLATPRSHRCLRATGRTQVAPGLQRPRRVAFQMSASAC